MYNMKKYCEAGVLCLLMFVHASSQCEDGQSATFGRWSGVAPEHATPVFVYSASGEEDSLVGACLSRCRELKDCAAVVVMYTKGNCQGVKAMRDTEYRMDNDAAYFKKMCLPLSENCDQRWWVLDSTPGYNLHTENSDSKVLHSSTIRKCYEALLMPNREKLYRSAQWIGPDSKFDASSLNTSDTEVGSCILNGEDKFTEPESYRVSNYYTFYLENQCRHDYLKKIDRCSYEEYYNQTLKHVEFTYKNQSRDECKKSCEKEDRFVCRGFTWQARRGGRASGLGGRGVCDLHSEDLVTTGSWLLRRTSGATYYRRVICLNLTVDCEGTDVKVTYRPRTLFKGRVYVPGHGDNCSARATNGVVKLTLPMYGDCNVNFAYGISNGPNGVVNRTMAYVMVMIQNNPIIQTAGDRWVRVGCSPGAQSNTLVNATVAVKSHVKPSSSEEIEGESDKVPVGASAVFGSAGLVMFVARADGAAAPVALGEPLQLVVETTESPEIEAYHLVASSRLGDSSVLLLDSRGCPTGQVDFPQFLRTKENGIQRLSARFKAFRFPTSHIVRFALMVRFCEDKCPVVNCDKGSQARAARETNSTLYSWDESAAVEQEARGVVARGAGCGGGGAGRGGAALELDLIVEAGDVLSADTLVRADHRVTYPESEDVETAVVCVHELLLVALALAWLTVQVVLLLGCCVLVKRYRNLAEMNMQKDYQSFDNVGFDTVSTHRRVHWPDQHVDVIHT